MTTKKIRFISLVDTGNHKGVSFSWTLVINDNNVYITTREGPSHYHVSFHASGINHIKIDKVGHKPKYPISWNNNSGIMIPHLSSDMRYITVNEAHKIMKRKKGGSFHCVKQLPNSVIVFYILLQDSITVNHTNLNHQMLEMHSLPDGNTLFLFYLEHKINDWEAIKINAIQEFNKQYPKIKDTQSIMISGVDKNGLLWLMKSII